MNYSEFILAMQCEVREQMEPEVEVEVYRAMKNNGTVRVGLVLMCPGVNTSPTIYLEEFYEQYQLGAGLADLAQTIKSLYEKVRVKNSYSFDHLFSYSKVRERIAYKVIHRESNEELLKQVPYEEYLDLAVVFFVLLENVDFGTATLLIRNEHLKKWRVSKADVYKAAKENTPRLLPAEFGKLTDYMYVVTNKTRSLGAAVMLYPHIWEEVVRQLGENFYILPSSIHELILIPESYGVNRTKLEIMVEEINDAEVAPEERLSGTVYYYSKKEERILL